MAHQQNLQIYRVAQKSKLYTPVDISTKVGSFFKNSFTVKLSRKFAIKRSLQFPSHLNGVTTLPCEILMSENIAYLYVVALFSKI